MGNILAKLGLRNRTEAAAYATRPKPGLVGLAPGSPTTNRGPE